MRRIFCPGGLMDVTRDQVIDKNGLQQASGRLKALAAGDGEH